MRIFGRTTEPRCIDGVGKSRPVVHSRGRRQRDVGTRLVLSSGAAGWSQRSNLRADKDVCGEPEPVTPRSGYPRVGAQKTPRLLRDEPGRHLVPHPRTHTPLSGERFFEYFLFGYQPPNWLLKSDATQTGIILGPACSGRLAGDIQLRLVTVSYGQLCRVVIGSVRYISSNDPIRRGQWSPCAGSPTL